MVEEPTPVDDEIDLDFSELALHHCSSTPLEEKGTPFGFFVPQHDPIQEKDESIEEANTVQENNHSVSMDLFLEENSLGFINVLTEELPAHEIVDHDKEIEKQNQVPSAPEIGETAPLCVPSTKERLHHPNLASVQSELMKVNTTFIDIATMKPLTVMELNELYENPYLPAVLSFEDEFVSKELNEEFNYASHPLYELLMKYQKSRQSLKVNMIDVNELKQVCQKHYSNCWSFHKATVRNEVCCRDRKLCKAYHIYE